MSPLAAPALVAMAIAACGSPQRAGTAAETPAAATAATSAGPPAAAAPAHEPLDVPFKALTLDNGLRVVLSRDTTAPIAVVAVYYNIGFRVEPKDRTGFAHLFEHMNICGRAIAPIFKEVTRLRAEPPPADELRGIQSYVAGVFVLRNSSRTGIIRQLNFLAKHGLGDDYLRDFAQRVWAVKPADVQRIAATYLDPKKMTIVVVGDRKHVDAQLRPWTGGAAGKAAPAGKAPPPRRQR